MSNPEFLESMRCLADLHRHRAAVRPGGEVPVSAPAGEFLVGADVMSPFVAARGRAEFLLETLIHDVGTRAATRERVRALMDQIETMVGNRPPAGLDGFEGADGVHPLCSALRAVRREARRSQSHVANLLGVSQSCVSEWESGAISPTLDTLERWAAVLGWSLELSWKGSS